MLPPSNFPSIDPLNLLFGYQIPTFPGIWNWATSLSSTTKSHCAACPPPWIRSSLIFNKCQHDSFFFNSGGYGEGLPETDVLMEGTAQLEMGKTSPATLPSDRLPVFCRWLPFDKSTSRQLPRAPVRCSAKWSASGTHRMGEIVKEWLWHRINKEEFEIVQDISSQRCMECLSNSKTGHNCACPLGCFKA